jgi:hypothetical protein
MLSKWSAQDRQGAKIPIFSFQQYVSQKIIIGVFLSRNAERKSAMIRKDRRALHLEFLP